MYHYIQSEPGLWTVGTGTPSTKGHPSKDWQPESDWPTSEAAASRVRFLNGGDLPKSGKTIVISDLVYKTLRDEYERGRAANSPFPRYHGTFEHFIEECLKDYMQFAWN